MKVIFLDVDGVLNYPSSDARAPSGAMGVASPPLSILKEIVLRTGARIVLISTWKNEWSRNEELCSADGKYLERKLYRNGMRILDKTTDPLFMRRGKGIRNWLDMHTHVDKWIVLDDMCFPDYDGEGIRDHLIQTDPLVGLTTEHIEIAERMLGKKEES